MAVVVCTADDTHKKYALNCIESGKYVFVEKPLSPDQEGCKERLLLLRLRMPRN